MLPVPAVDEPQSALSLVGLPPLMEQTAGAAEVIIGLLDGPVAGDHLDLRDARIRELVPDGAASADSIARQHGTLVARILVGARGGSLPGICPGCTLLVRPIFRDAGAAADELPSATPHDLAAAIIETVDAGATVLNVSAGIAAPLTPRNSAIVGALTYATQRGVIVVAAGGNQGAVGGSAITRHPWVIPVAACDRRGRPADYSNLGRSIATGGLLAPGEPLPRLTDADASMAFGGTSVATPFVTGAIALLWSMRPDLRASELRAAVTAAGSRRPMSIVPPLLNAWAVYEMIAGTSVYPGTAAQ